MRGQATTELVKGHISNRPPILEQPPEVKEAYDLRIRDSQKQTLSQVLIREEIRKLGQR